MEDPVPPVKVCQLISSFHPIWGGAEQATLHLSRELTRRGCGVTVVTRRYPGLPFRDEVGGVPVIRAGTPSQSKIGALTFAIHAFFLLATRLRDHRVVHAQGPDVQLLVAILCRVLLGRRLVLTIHSDPHLQLRIGEGGGGPRFQAVKRWADHIGVLGRHVARVLESEGIPADRIGLLPNGVDTERYAPPTTEERKGLRDELGLAPEDVAGVFVGRLVSLKRVDLLIRAWARSGAADRGPLLVAGDGSERDELGRLAAEVAPESVRFLGKVDRPEHILKACDLFILPSQREGLSVALLEAMACGLVPVVSDLEPNRAVVEHGVNGLVFTTDDGEDLERVLGEALGADRNRLGAAAARHVQERYSLESTVSAHLSVYHSLAPTSPSSSMARRVL